MVRLVFKKKKNYWYSDAFMGHKSIYVCSLVRNELGFISMIVDKDNSYVIYHETFTTYTKCITATKSYLQYLGVKFEKQQRNIIK